VLGHDVGVDSTHPIEVIASGHSTPRGELDRRTVACYRGDAGKHGDAAALGDRTNAAAPR